MTQTITDTLALSPSQSIFIHGQTKHPKNSKMQLKKKKKSLTPKWQANYRVKGCFFHSVGE